jgi:hypothetical protein
VAKPLDSDNIPDAKGIQKRDSIRMQVTSCGTGTLEQVLKLNEILTEGLSESIDVKDDAQDEVTRLRAELADLRARGLAFLKKTLDDKKQSAVELSQLRGQLEEAERLLDIFKAYDNRIIKNDLLDTILEDGSRVSIGEYWRLRGEKDPRQLWPEVE